MSPQRAPVPPGLAAGALLVAVLASGCGSDEAPPPAAPPPSPEGSPPAEARAGAPWFRECARERGLVFEHRSGHVERYYFPEIMGGGAALLDADGDGDLDAYLVQSGSVVVPRAEREGNRLFENLGGGRFADATEESGAGDRGYGMGAATGDADGDGRVDLYVCNLDENALLLNRGGLAFEDASAASGAADPSWSVSATFLDHDRDGDLDLFVVNYIYWTVADDLFCQGPPHGATYCSPKSYDAPAPDTLLENLGEGRFRDVSSDAGLRAAFGNGLGVVAADFDVDGWLDVYVANDGTENQLWENRHDGTFVDVALRSGTAVDQDGVAKAGMGVSAADVDDDGDEDLIVVNLTGESDSFYRNDRTGFMDRTPVVGLARVARSFTRFGCGLVDLDDDGLLDFYVADGRVIHPPDAYEGDPFAEENLLYRGEPGPRFVEVQPRGGTASPLVATSRAAAFGDVDGDGGIDVLVSNKDAPAHLLLNVVPGRGRSLRLLVLERGGAPALGARVVVDVAGRTVLRTVRTGYSYGAANEPLVHVGLGATAAVPHVTVTWVDGTSEDFGAQEAGEVRVLRRGEGR